MTIDDSGPNASQGDQATPAPRTDSASRPWDGAAIVAITLAAAALLTLATPLIALALSAIAIVEALISRRRLRTDDCLRGAGLSAAAFIVGVGVVAYATFQVVAPMLLLAGAALPS